jgi:hypothetical protein
MALVVSPEMSEETTELRVGFMNGPPQFLLRRRGFHPAGQTNGVFQRMDRPFHSPPGDLGQQQDLFEDEVDVPGQAQGLLPQNSPLIYSSVRVSELVGRLTPEHESSLPTAFERLGPPSV